MTWVAAGIASGAATNAAVMYVKKNRDAKKDAKKRPQYEVPEEIKQNLTQAQQQALQGLPEEQKQQFLTNLQRNSAQSLTAGSSRKAGLAGIAGVNQQQADSYGNLMAADSQARMQNQDRLSGVRSNMADYKDQAFQFNKVNPYYEQIAARNKRDEQFSQSLNNAGSMVGGMGGGKGKSPSGGGQMAAPSNLNSDLSMKTPQGYNQQIGLANPYTASQYPNQYGY